MNDAKQERNWVLEQANEIAIEVAKRLPPFNEYSDFIFAINNYINAGESICAKFMAISACVFRFENKYNDIKDNLWLKPLREELAQISAEDKQILYKLSINSPPEELEKICDKFTTWMDQLVLASKDFMPKKLDPLYKHNANPKEKLRNMDINFMNKVLLAGSEHTNLGGENFLKALNKAQVKIVVAAAKGDKETDGFGPYWPSNGAEEMTVAGLSNDMQLFQIDIKNGGCFNLDWDGLLRMSKIIKAYAQFKKDANLTANNVGFFQKELKRIFVHCAMGRGRTGSFNSLLVLLENIYFQDDEEAKLFRNIMSNFSSNEKLSGKDKMLLINELVFATNFLRQKRGHATEWFGQLCSVIYNLILMDKILSNIDESKDILKAQIEELRKLLDMNNDKFPVTKIAEYKINKDKKLDLIINLTGVIDRYQRYCEKSQVFPNLLLKLNEFTLKLQKISSDDYLDENKISSFMYDVLKDVEKVREFSLPLVSKDPIIMELKKCSKELNAWSGEAKKIIDFENSNVTALPLLN